VVGIVLNRAQRRISSLPHDVYRAYTNGELVYIGISVDVFTRLREHKKYAPWYWEADRLEVVRRPDRKAARAEEARVIAETTPRYNVTRENAWGCVESQEALDAFSMWRDEDGVWWIDDEG
jgi:excinuclease UvrABC nuclease subunit